MIILKIKRKIINEQVKSNEPKTLPWGMPDNTLYSEDKASVSHTCWVPSPKKSINQAVKLPDMLKPFKVWINLMFEIFSNAVSNVNNFNKLYPFYSLRPMIETCQKLGQMDFGWIKMISQDAKRHVQCGVGITRKFSIKVDVHQG